MGSFIFLALLGAGIGYAYHHVTGKGGGLVQALLLGAVGGVVGGIAMGFLLAAAGILILVAGCVIGAFVLVSVLSGRLGKR
ncbi:MAG: GlsB/YeaQ/YmgE family stress response membrane protein [Pseudomonadota bacterium]